VGEPLRLTRPDDGGGVEHRVAGGESLVAGDMKYIVSM